jgi:adenylate cyclase
MKKEGNQLTDWFYRTMDSKLTYKALSTSSADEFVKAFLRACSNSTLWAANGKFSPERRCCFGHLARLSSLIAPSSEQNLLAFASKAKFEQALKARKKNKLAILLLIFASGLGLNAQTGLDSLYSVWQDPSQADSVRVKAYKTYIWDAYLFSDPDSAAILAEALHAYAEKHNYPQAANQALTLQGIVYEMRGNYSLALEYLQKSLAADEAIGNKWGISENLIAIGVLFDEQGDLPRALEYYNKALAVDESIGNKGGMAMSLNNIGNIQSLQGNSSRALEYYLRALAIDEELGVKQGIATELINIGQIYHSQRNTTLALEYYERALAINEEIGDKDGTAASLNSIGSLCQAQGNYLEALAYYEKALSVFQDIGIKRGIADTQSYIGNLYLEQGKANLALGYCEKSFALASEMGALEQLRQASACLYRSYKAMGDSRSALAYYEQMIAARDSIYNEENTKKLTRLQMQYEFDKKEEATKIEQEKKDAIALEELQRHKLVRNGFMGGFAVVLLFAGVFFVQRNRIGKEKKRSEEMLLNILPAATAQELKEKGRSDAQLIEAVTVLFTDFQSFTAISEQLSPKELVKDLHECFSAFDRICEKHGIEKIKTIGDSYMAAGGLPIPNTTHAQDVVNAALEMSEFVEKGKRSKREKGLPFFEVRIGIHTGPVVAGIVGIKKFQYDIWGDTVNTASRMESSGEVGKVNISQSTYELVKDLFTCEYRGKIEAKGKGKLGMYFVSLGAG